MENYYFTFGSNHRMTNGQALHNRWIRVVAESYNEARSIFVEKFTSVFMEAKDKFAFQYDEKSFDKTYCPEGEHLVIKSDEAIKLEKANCDHHYIPTNSKWQGQNQRECYNCGDVID